MTSKFAKYVPEEDKKKQREHIGVTWDSLPDKPFGEEYELVLANNVTVNCNVNMGGGFYGIAEMKPNFELGRTYRVIFDDEEYNCVAKIVERLTIIGNAAFSGGEDTGEPFIMLPEMNNTMVISSEGEHTFSVSTKTFTTLDTQFLPKATETEKGVVSVSEMRDSLFVPIELVVSTTRWGEIARAVQSYPPNNIMLYNYTEDGELYEYFLLTLNIAKNPVKPTFIVANGSGISKLELTINGPDDADLEDLVLESINTSPLVVEVS